MRRPTPTALILLVATLLVGWLIWSELEGAGLVGAKRDAGRRAWTSTREESDAIARDLERGGYGDLLCFLLGLDLEALGVLQPTADNQAVRTVLSNSFGFGGNNCSLVFERCDA